MQFVFPQDLLSLQTITSKEELNLIIEKLARETNTNIQYRYPIRKNYLYAICIQKQCKACLRYKKSEENVFLLTLARRSHRHSLKLQDKNKIIKDFIKDFPQQMNMSQARSITLHQLSETHSRFYYYYKKIRNNHASLRELLQQLDIQGYDIHMKPFQLKTNEIPELLILVSPQMKAKFQKYIQFFSFDFTFHLIKQSKENNIFKVGLILDMSWSRRIVPFALVISLKQTKQVYCEIFRSISEIMGKLPKIIFTDDSLSAFYAIQQLWKQNEFQGEHCLDCFHIMRNIRKKLTVKQNLRVFSELVHCRDPQTFESLLQAAYEKLERVSFKEHICTVLTRCL